MESTLERLPEGRVVLEVTVPAPDVVRALDEAYRRIARRVNIPGFRRGKAPRPLVERLVGKERILQEAIDPLVARAYASAVQEQAIDPVAPPEIELAEGGEGQPLRFKATVVVKPEVELGDYAGIAIARQVGDVSEEDVDESLEEMRKARAVWVPAEDEQAAADMLVVLDVTGEVDESAAEGGDAAEGGSAAEDQSGGAAQRDNAGGGRTRRRRPIEPQLGAEAVLGAEELRSDLEKVVLGMRVGETREVEIHYAADDVEADLAGRSAFFRVALRELKRRRFPELDDEFAREVGEAQTLEEWRPILKNRLRQAALARADEELGRQVTEAVCAQAQVDIPPVMVEREIDASLRGLEEELGRSDVTVESFLTRQGRTLDDLRADLRESAAGRVKTSLVLEAIAHSVGIGVNNDELRRRLERLAVQYGQDAEAFRKVVQRPEFLAQLRQDIRLKKAVSFLKERALANAQEASATVGEAGE